MHPSSPTTSLDNSIVDIKKAVAWFVEIPYKDYNVIDSWVDVLCRGCNKLNKEFQISTLGDDKSHFDRLLNLFHNVDKIQKHNLDETQNSVKPSTALAALYPIVVLKFSNLLSIDVGKAFKYMYSSTTSTKKTGVGYCITIAHLVTIFPPLTLKLINQSCVQKARKANLGATVGHLTSFVYKVAKMLDQQPESFTTDLRDSIFIARFWEKKNSRTDKRKRKVEKEVVKHKKRKQ